MYANYNQVKATYFLRITVDEMKNYGKQNEINTICFYVFCWCTGS